MSRETPRIPSVSACSVSTRSFVGMFFIFSLSLALEMTTVIALACRTSYGEGSVCFEEVIGLVRRRIGGASEA